MILFQLTIEHNKSWKMMTFADENESEIEVDTPPESEIEVDMVDPKIVEINTTSAWDQNKSGIAKPGPIIKLSTD